MLTALSTVLILVTTLLTATVEAETEVSVNQSDTPLPILDLVTHNTQCRCVNIMPSIKFIFLSS